MNNEKCCTEITEEFQNSGKEKLHSWLNKSLKILLTDGRILVGNFLCTDRDANIILGACLEYMNEEDLVQPDSSRTLGLVMIPGRHIVSIHINASLANDYL
ncbi:hypothetical protein O3M35_009473 [Rhynocoris fuscipes]|uniref:Sm domain-containing protein n=1 Tax=Rhynocoris fuscipes TaxID=488301 RepID=A0AAW1D321_9HEMI